MATRERIKKGFSKLLKEEKLKLIANYFENPGEVVSLLEEAVTNARSKAAVVARAGGRTLGRLIHAGFSTSGNVTHTMNRNMMMAKAASLDAAEASPTELDPGVITVNANVDLEFALE